MAKTSAGVLLFRRDEEGLAVLLVHPGGPFWAKRDLGSWSIPKGEYESGEEPRAVAAREFGEETGLPLPPGDLMPLGVVRQAGGKVVTAFALEGDLDPHGLRSNTFELEWPPRSGVRRAFPEVDKAEWFSIPQAQQKILSAQRPFLDRLEAEIADSARALATRSPQEDGPPR
jgi:predicted NUDIX family NTP pyrophosphohydrolase